MERRKSERKFVDVNVYVSLPGISAVCCTASDISNAGMFLKTNPLYVSKSKKVDLVFALRFKSSNVIRMRHLSAMVTRTESNGVGLVFCNNKSTTRSHKSI